MGKQILTFGDSEIKKRKITGIKVLLFKNYVDIEHVLAPNKISSGKINYKYFIGYLFYDYKIKSLHIMLPKS